jgi:hypothetical protein
MKTEFHQHPDGKIFVRTDYGTYSDTPENFEADFGVTLPTLPPGAIERIYTQGKRHAIHDDEGNVIAGGPMPWDFGDQVISSIETGMTAWTQRQESQEHPPPSMTSRMVKAK